jgi:hypothetical protein
MGVFEIVNITSPYWFYQWLDCALSKEWDRSITMRKLLATGLHKAI